MSQKNDLVNSLIIKINLNTKTSLMLGTFLMKFNGWLEGIEPSSQAPQARVLPLNYSHHDFI